jgi:hypothetical protein
VVGKTEFGWLIIAVLWPGICFILKTNTELSFSAQNSHTAICITGSCWHAKVCRVQLVEL